jgi:hypothetical protein
MADDIHVGDEGTQFVATFRDALGAIVPLGAATVKQLLFRKTDGTVLTKAASFYTDGSDGIIYWATVAGDLSVAGPWEIQGYVEVSGLKLHSDVQRFTVNPNLN